LSNPQGAGVKIGYHCPYLVAGYGNDLTGKRRK
jgi:hypothetical protein